MAATAGTRRPSAAKSGAKTTKARTSRAKPQTGAQRTAAGLPHPVEPRDLGPGTPPLNATGSPQAAAAAAGPGGPLNGLPFEPVRLETKKAEDKQPSPRIHLFSIDGTDYFIDARPSMSIALQFMHFAGMSANRKPGEANVRDAAAISYLMTSLLGEDGWRALREFPDLSPKQFTMITEIATTVVMGVLELPKGPASA